jgi:hypothetical protein
MVLERKPPRPTALPVSPGAIPEALKALPQWVVWQYRWLPERQQWTKPPSQISRQEAKTNDPATWTTFPRAYATYQQGTWDGIGFVLREEQGLVGVDLDHCRDPESGEIEPTAQDIVRELQSYTEVSPSGRGLRIFARGRLPPQGRKRGGIEMYTGLRYLTMTGAHVAETPRTLEAREEALMEVHGRVFRAPSPSPPARRAAGTPGLPDDDVLSRALAARNATKFAKLWAGELAGYPSHSECDLALCSLLAFWSQDTAQIDRLFRRSGLYRDKWDSRRGETTHGQHTIARALIRTEVWRGLSQPRPSTPGPEPPPPRAPEKPMLLGADELTEERVIWVASRQEKALLQAAGYRCCLAVPEIPPAGANYRAALSYLKSLEQPLAKVKQHVLLLPDTLDGRALSLELARRLGPEFVRLPIWPSECESVAHVHAVHGVELLQEVIEHTRRLPLADIVEFDSLRQRLHDLYRLGSRPIGLAPGWPSLDHIYRIRPGQITLLLGGSGIGKSTFVAALAVNLARQQQWPLTIFSPEQAPPEDYTTMLLQQWTRKPFWEGPQTRMSEEEMDQGVDALQDAITLIWPEDKSPSVDYLLTLAKKEVFRRGIKGLVIDPWSEVEHDMSHYGREDLYIQAMLTKIRKFARTYQVHVWICVHPPTLEVEIDRDHSVLKYPVPTLPSGGQKWKDKVDNLLGFEREIGHPIHGNILTLHTLKIRFQGYDGQVLRKARLYFHAESGTFSDLGVTNGGPK